MSEDKDNKVTEIPTTQDEFSKKIEITMKKCSDVKWAAPKDIKDLKDRYNDCYSSFYQKYLSDKLSSKPLSVSEYLNLGYL